MATAGNAQDSVEFTAPASNGGFAITAYTVTSNPGGLTATGSASPLVVSGLTNGQPYTFTVTTTNTAGLSAPSVASDAVIPDFATALTALQSGVSIYQSGASVVLDLVGLRGSQTVSIFDVQGKQIGMRQAFGGDKIAIPIVWNNGVYIVKVLGVQGALVSKLIIR